MDLSKLPRMSETPAPPPPPADPNAPAINPATTTTRRRRDDDDISLAPSSAAEAWFSIAIGAVLLLMSPHTLGYFSSKLFGPAFAPFPDPTLPPPAMCDFILYTDG